MQGGAWQLDKRRSASAGHQLTELRSLAAAGSPGVADRLDHAVAGASVLLRQTLQLLQSDLGQESLGQLHLIDSVTDEVTCLEVREELIPDILQDNRTESADV